ncbi:MULTISPECIES: DUF7511 domain-containing protein [unclassified Halobacterium]|jgi:hypothetical protein|uniref:DUF7511 domain-containing protein n=1 Tax=unclassified Halobacterium TaxID=2668073 RepID=UPI001E55ECE6|nr:MULTISPECIES: hypothetical protein [unclassified Halobacterium]MCD2199683.1 hypothetical protein [Halobacterium sp. KA-4]MCD2203607.1 hypothetical protein [Halobacterium sp. KA-6]
MSTDSTRGAQQSRDDVDRTPLDATVVRYQNTPDRCTLSPPNVDSDRRLTAWLSVDADALVTLAENR